MTIVVIHLLEGVDLKFSNYLDNNNLLLFSLFTLNAISNSFFLSNLAFLFLCGILLLRRFLFHWLLDSLTCHILNNLLSARSGPAHPADIFHQLLITERLNHRLNHRLNPSY